MFFRKKHKGTHIAYTFSEVCDLLTKMGVELKPGKSQEVASAVVCSKDMNWLISGDLDGLTISAVINAPDSWDHEAWLRWLIKKNFVFAIYDSQEKVFVLTCHVMLRGGVVIQNVARLVIHFDEFITEFLNTMKLNRASLKALR
jgi:hypothetical protein